MTPRGAKAENGWSPYTDIGTSVELWHKEKLVMVTLGWLEICQSNDFTTTLNVYVHDRPRYLSNRGNDHVR